VNGRKGNVVEEETIDSMQHRYPYAPPVMLITTMSAMQVSRQDRKATRSGVDFCDEAGHVGKLELRL